MACVVCFFGFDSSIVAYFRYDTYKAAADEESAYKARMKPVWDAENAAKAAKVNREGMISLAKEAGVPVSLDKRAPDVAYWALRFRFIPFQVPPGF